MTMTNTLKSFILTLVVAFTMGTTAHANPQYSDKTLLDFIQVLERLSEKGGPYLEVIRSSESTEDQRKKADLKLAKMTGRIAIEEGFSAKSFIELSGAIRSTESLRIRVAELYGRKPVSIR